MKEQLLYGEALGLMTALKNDYIERQNFLSELQRLFPFNPRALRKDTWSNFETVLHYYELDADMIFRNFEPYSLEEFFQAIDEEQIRELLINCSKHKVINLSKQIVLKELIPFFREKRVPVPDHLLSLEAQPPSPEDDQMLDSIPQEPKKTKKTKTTLRKEIMRAAAIIYWDKEVEALKSVASKTKKLTSPTELSKHKDMILLVNLVNKLGGIKSIEDKAHSTSGIDPEWFSDLYPGEKPGPKKTNSEMKKLIP